MMMPAHSPSLSLNDSASPSEKVWERVVDDEAHDEAIICHANEEDMLRDQLEGRYKVASDFEINRNRSMYTMSMIDDSVGEGVQC